MLGVGVVLDGVDDHLRVLVHQLRSRLVSTAQHRPNIILAPTTPIPCATRLVTQVQDGVLRVRGCRKAANGRAKGRDGERRNKGREGGRVDLVALLLDDALGADLLVELLDRLPARSARQRECQRARAGEATDTGQPTAPSSSPPPSRHHRHRSASSLARSSLTPLDSPHLLASFCPLPSSFPSGPVSRPRCCIELGPAGTASTETPQHSSAQALWDCSCNTEGEGAHDG